MRNLLSGNERGGKIHLCQLCMSTGWVGVGLCQDPLTTRHLQDAKTETGNKEEEMRLCTALHYDLHNPMSFVWVGLLSVPEIS